MMEVFLLLVRFGCVRTLIGSGRGLVCCARDRFGCVRRLVCCVEPFIGKNTPYIKASDHQSGSFFILDMDLSRSDPSLSHSSACLSRSLYSLSRSQLRSSRRAIFWNPHPIKKAP